MTLINTSLLLFLLLFSCTEAISAQTFSTFSGDLITLEEKGFRYGYEADPSLFDTVGTISFPKLDFLPRETEVNFPGVTMADHFGFILQSTLRIDTAGCHVFTLASDDGSRLWINDSLAINNDKPHQWRVKRDSQRLAAREHQVKVWYFNAYIPLMGLALKAERVADSICGRQEISLSAEALFAFDAHTIAKQAYARLDSLAAKLQGAPGRKVTITGHTDDRGDETCNQRRSLRRAEVVRDYLFKQLPDKNISFIVIGRGEAEPVVENVDEASRRQNRRVSILIE